MASRGNIESKLSESIVRDGIEIPEGGDDIVFATAGSSNDIGTSLTSERKTIERGSVGDDERELTKIKADNFRLKKEMERRIEEASETRAELSARKRRLMEFASEFPNV